MLNIVMIVIEQSMIYLPLVLGSYISFSLLKIPDLSLETSYLMGAFFGASVLSCVQGLPLWIALPVVLGSAALGGCLVGAVASSITLFVDIPHLLSSIITFGLFQGFFLICSQPYVSLASYDNILMHMSYIVYHPELITLLLINFVMIVGVWYILQTQLGYSFVIFGYNPFFFQHFKISKSYVFMVGVMLAHALSGLAGFLFAQTNSLLELNMGVGKALFCITALILGKAIWRSLQASVCIPLLGVIVYFAVQQVLLQVGFDLKYFVMVQSLLVFAILVSVYKKNQVKFDQLGL